MIDVHLGTYNTKVMKKRGREKMQVAMKGIVLNVVGCVVKEDVL